MLIVILLNDIHIPNMIMSFSSVTIMTHFELGPIFISANNMIMSFDLVTIMTHYELCRILQVSFNAITS